MKAEALAQVEFLQYPVPEPVILSAAKNLPSGRETYWHGEILRCAPNDGEGDLDEEAYWHGEILRCAQNDRMRVL